MFRGIIFPIFRSTRLCVTACGIMHPRCCRPPAVKIKMKIQRSSERRQPLNQQRNFTSQKTWIINVCCYLWMISAFRIGPTVPLPWTFSSSGFMLPMLITRTVFSPRRRWTRKRSFVICVHCALKNISPICDDIVITQIVWFFRRGF